MSVYQTIYETIDNDAEEVRLLIGAGDLKTVNDKRERVKLFLNDNDWNLERFKRWLKKGIMLPDKKLSNKVKSRGFGDTVAKMTSAVGIKPCGGCKKRQEKLNKIFPYKD